MTGAEPKGATPRAASVRRFTRQLGEIFPESSRLADKAHMRGRMEGQRGARR